MVKKMYYSTWYFLVFSSGCDITIVLQPAATSQ